MANTQHKMNERIQDLARKIEGAAAVSIAEQLLHRTGRVAAAVAALPASQDRQHELMDRSIRGHLERVAQTGGHTGERARALSSGAPMTRRVKGLDASVSLAELLRNKQGKGTGTGTETKPEITWGTGDWKYIQLRVDNVKCVVSGRIERGG